MMHAPMSPLAVGDRIRIKGTPHEPGQTTGTVALVEHGPAYGIRFDAGSDDEMSGEIHKWYVGSELELENAAGGDVMRRLDSPRLETRAMMSAADINDLPDEMFAYIEPGGKKDSTGRTVPRSKRHFPIHDACLAAGTMIPLLDGRTVAVENLVGLGEFGVYSFDPETRSIVPGCGHSARETMRTTVLAHVRLDNGEVLKTTPDHRFMLRSGEYRQAQDLAPGDSLMPLRRKVYATRASKKTGHEGKVYEFIFQPFYRFWELTHHAVDRHAHGALVDGNVVHHRNEDPFDNRPENLQQMTRAAHCSHHGEENGWKHVERLKEGSRRRWAQPGEREKQAEHRRRHNEEMKAAGVLPSKPMKQWCATRESAAAVHQRYLGGESISALARELAVSQSGIKLGFRRYGLVSRRELTKVNNHKVLSVEFHEGDPEPVYDISVDEFHNFATAAGVFVHNSHVRNALARMSESPFGQKAAAKIHKAAQKFGIGERSEEPDSEYRRDVPAVCTRSFEFETRSVADDGRTLEGYVAVFGHVARINARDGDFDEEIHRGAFDRSLRSAMPVMQFEHGRDPRVGALPIGVYDVFEPDSHGYRVRGRLLDDPVVDPIRKAISAKAIKGMSWRMQVPDSGQRWTRSRYGTTRSVDKRDIIDADVPEAGPVVFPAYNATTVSVRSMLAAMDSEEIRSLVHELAAHLGLAVDLTDLTGRPGAWSTGGGEYDADTQERSASPAPQNGHLRQRLDTGALRVRGILQ